jgi:hypothetical protein
VTRTAKFAHWVLIVSAVAFLGIGISFMFFPSQMSGAVSVSTTSGTGVGDIRTVYGGLDIATGILLGYLALRKRWVDGLAVAALFFVCIVCGRLLGLVLDSPHNVISYILFGLEITAAVLAVVAYFFARQSPSETAMEVAATAVQTAMDSQAQATGSPEA